MFHNFPQYSRLLAMRVVAKISHFNPKMNVITCTHILGSCHSKYGAQLPPTAGVKTEVCSQALLATVDPWVEG
jgi:hypothetical protein